MWRIVHQFGSPPWVYRFCDRVIPWLLPITVVALLTGSVWGLLFAPTDYKQGDSYRIIYIHVPAAVVALAGYYVMALAGLVSLVSRQAGRYSNASGCSHRCRIHGDCVDNRCYLGQTHLGCVVGLGCAHHVNVDSLLPLRGGDSVV